MNREETWALFKQGKDAWNEWAKELSSERSKLIQEGIWKQNADPPVRDPVVRAWVNEATVDFAGCEFLDTEFSFAGFLFPWEAFFEDSKFLNRISFEKAEFIGRADFTAAFFEGGSNFRRAVFRDPASFRGAIFNGRSDFFQCLFQLGAFCEEAHFRGDASFKSATFKGLYFEEAEFASDALFNDALFEEKASFKNVKIGGELNFIGLRCAAPINFKGISVAGDAWFRTAKFEGTTIFTEAKFKSKADFRFVEFRKFAYFRSARFEGEAEFSETIFEDTVIFTISRFDLEVKFFEAEFRAFASFERARFYGPVDFKAARSSSAFDLTDASFLDVPDFNQMSFLEAPRLDALNIRPQRFVALREKMKAHRFSHLSKYIPVRLGEWLVENFLGDKEISARWRALQRLADRAHDHGKEQEFFRRELKARRFSSEPWYQTVFFSFPYQLLSDFGNALVRPILWMLVFLTIFGNLYLGRSGNTTDSFWENTTILVSAAASGLTGSTPPLEGRCGKGEGSPARAAVALSARNSLLFAAGLLGDKSRQIYACLYGTVQIDGRSEPRIPDEVAFWGVIQMLFSAILIFLFGLALRNNFKIG